MIPWPQMKDPTCSKTLRPVYGPQRPPRSERGSPGFSEAELKAGREEDRVYRRMAKRALDRRLRLNGI